jgi:hypothetical protein
MLGKVVMEGLRLINLDLEPCPYQILTSMGGLEEAQKITKDEVVIQVNPSQLVNYSMVHAKIMVMQATSYDVLVG